MPFFFFDYLNSSRNLFISNKKGGQSRVLLNQRVKSRLARKLDFILPQIASINLHNDITQEQKVNQRLWPMINEPVLRDCFFAWLDDQLDITVINEPLYERGKISFKIEHPKLNSSWNLDLNDANCVFLYWWILPSNRIRKRLYWRMKNELDTCNLSLDTMPCPCLITGHPDNWYRIDINWIWLIEKF